MIIFKYKFLYFKYSNLALQENITTFIFAKGN